MISHSTGDRSTGAFPRFVEHRLKTAFRPELVSASRRDFQGKEVRGCQCSATGVVESWPKHIEPALASEFSGARTNEPGWQTNTIHTLDPRDAAAVSVQSASSEFSPPVRDARIAVPAARPIAAQIHAAGRWLWLRLDPLDGVIRRTPKATVWQ